MNQKLDPQTLDEIVEQIVKVLDPKRIILFGSHARGEAGPDSDVDILVVADVPDPDGFRSVETRQALGDTPFPIDLIVVTPDEWKMWQGFVNTVMGQAAKYGKVLYERAQSAVVVG